MTVVALPSRPGIAIVSGTTPPVPGHSDLSADALQQLGVTIEVERSWSCSVRGHRPRVERRRADGFESSKS